MVDYIYNYIAIRLYINCFQMIARYCSLSGVNKLLLLYNIIAVYRIFQ